MNLENKNIKKIIFKNNYTKKNTSEKKKSAETRI